MSIASSEEISLRFLYPVRDRTSTSAIVRTTAANPATESIISMICVVRAAPPVIVSVAMPVFFQTPYSSPSVTLTRYVPVLTIFVSAPAPPSAIAENRSAPRSAYESIPNSAHMTSPSASSKPCFSYPCETVRFTSGGNTVLCA